ncbi:peptidoglycan editing factor PgeF [uncultured Clostridium sp.]|uniref:peptidoglycan editing factor PgeF n=1 Tax=uncultured Clostridium sp. TaxID=59620 RepID=UPI0025F263F1|nr:peptidoglycan editing factor PgeF [uncultured Clostridium sp.]
MKLLDLKTMTREEDFLKFEGEHFTVVFTNAENSRSFNRNTEAGICELNSLKDRFKVKDVAYLKQIHSDTILNYKLDDAKFNNNEGDAIVTDEKEVIIGVFTADCVPVILVDDKRGISAAIHSGWRGTFESITLKTVEKMKSEHGCKGEDIKAFIGPHIRKCCYEVSEELKEKFLDKKKEIDPEILFDNRNLNLEACIEKDLLDGGIKAENINSLNLCTYCCDKIKLHSYRKSEGSYGRMFTFVILH